MDDQRHSSNYLQQDFDDVYEELEKAGDLKYYLKQEIQRIERRQRWSRRAIQRLTHT